MSEPLPCIVCGFRPESAAPPGLSEGQQPYGATTFTSHGQYGSTVFDEIGGRSLLEVNVCDPCVLAAAAAGRVLHGTVVRFERRKFEYVPWVPPPEVIAYQAERAARGEQVGGAEPSRGVEPR